MIARWYPTLMPRGCPRRCDYPRVMAYPIWAHGACWSGVSSRGSRETGCGGAAACIPRSNRAPCRPQHRRHVDQRPSEPGVEIEPRHAGLLHPHAHGQPRCRRLRRYSGGQQLGAGGRGTPRGGRSSTVTSSRPTSPAIARPVSGWSPLIISGRMPATRQAAIAVRASGRVSQPCSADEGQVSLRLVLRQLVGRSRLFREGDHPQPSRGQRIRCLPGARPLASVSQWSICSPVIRANERSVFVSSTSASTSTGAAIQMSASSNSALLRCSKRAWKIAIYAALLEICSGW